MEWNKLSKMAALGLAGMMLLGTVMTASADEPEKYPAKSNADVTFIAGKIEEENPPPDPDEDGDPKPPLVPGGDDYLKVYAPELNFGTVTIVDADKEYPVKTQTLVDGSDIKYVRTYMAVTDQTGEQKGWNVTVKMDEPFADAATGLKKLAGVNVIMENGQLSTHNSDGVVSGLTGIGNSGKITIAPTQASQKVFSAAIGTAGGTYIQSFGTDDSTLIPQEDPTSDPKANFKDDNGDDVLYNPAIRLEVPRGTNPEAEKYKTELIWTITNTP